jgi:hypothetical protein
VTTPRLKSASLFAVLSLTLAGAILGYGIGAEDTDASNPPFRHPEISVPPSTVIHAPMICRKDGCAELQPSAP